MLLKMMRKAMNYILLIAVLNVVYTESASCNNGAGKWSKWVKSSIESYNCACGPASNPIISYPMEVEANLANHGKATDLRVTALHAMELSTEGKYKCFEKKLADCEHYRFRYCCPKLKCRQKIESQWKEWIKLKNHDCNCGNISYFASMYPEKACLNPIALRVRSLIRNNSIYISPHLSLSTTEGFRCSRGTGSKCSDYKIRFMCKKEGLTATSSMAPFQRSPSVFATESTTFSTDQSTALVTTTELTSVTDSITHYDVNNETSPLELINCVSGILNKSNVNIALIEKCNKNGIKNAPKSINLIQNGIVVSVIISDSKHVQIPKSFSNFSTISVKNIDINSNGTRFSVIVMQFRLSKKKHKSSLSNRSSEFIGQPISTSIPLVDIPVLSITAFETATNRLVSANVSYDIDVGNDSTIHDFAQTWKQNVSFLQRNIIRNITYVCSFFDPISQKYSDVGCKTKIINLTKVICDCNHTTIFAILLSIAVYTIPKQIQIISFAMELISVISLVFTLMVLSDVRRNVDSNRFIVQFNLVIALMLFHVTNLFYNVALKHDPSCKTIAVLIHFFLLATAAWMLVEGLNLAMVTSEKTLLFCKQKARRWTVIRLSVGWGIPFVIVFTSAVAGFSAGTYMDRDPKFGYIKCWLSDETGTLLGAAIIPVIIIYCINLLLVGKVLIFVWKMIKKTDHLKPLNEQTSKHHTSIVHLEQVKATFKGLLLLLPALGLGWIFGFLSDGVPSLEWSTILMYLDVVFNGLQGFFLMLVYCVFGSEVRSAWVRKTARRKVRSIQSFQSKKSTIRRQIQQSSL